MGCADSCNIYEDDGTPLARKKFPGFKCDIWTGFAGCNVSTLNQNNQLRLTSLTSDERLECINGTWEITGNAGGTQRVVCKKSYCPAATEPLKVSGRWKPRTIACPDNNCPTTQITQSVTRSNSAVATNTTATYMEQALGMGLDFSKSGMSLPVATSAKFKKNTANTVSTAITNGLTYDEKITQTITPKSPSLTGNATLWQWELTTELPEDCGGKVTIDTPIWTVTSRESKKPCCLPGYMCDTAINSGHMECTSGAGCIAENCPDICKLPQGGKKSAHDSTPQCYHTTQCTDERCQPNDVWPPTVDPAVFTRDPQNWCDVLKNDKASCGDNKSADECVGHIVSGSSANTCYWEAGSCNAQPCEPFPPPFAP